MTCCSGPVTWECCYPDPCGCDLCCCQGSNCSGGCSSSSYCGIGGCCTCNSNGWGFAWKPGCPGDCGLCPGCGGYLFFNAAGLDFYQGVRVDSHNEAAISRADLTKALFMQMAPLSQGIIYGVLMIDNPWWQC
jgi:hypothetical protein